MEWLIQVFGSGKDLTILQMSCRAVVVFLAALAMLRLTGQRTFGHKTAVDQVVMIMLGAVLSRGVTGSSPFLPVMCASLVIVLFHRLLGWLCTYNDRVGDLIKGMDIILYRDGRYLEKNMKRCMVTKKDLLESVRIEINEDDLSNVALLSMERCGSISVVKKEIK
jgi:uncharacterized membrane protein YcaP (DUF421 family)